MADRPASEKTEPPTPERLRKARQEGQLPQSQELPSALILGGMLLACWLAAPDLWRWFTREVEQGLTLRLSGAFDIDTVLGLLRTKTGDALGAMAPFLVTASVASIFGGVLVGGWGVSAKAVRLNFQRLTPSASLKSFINPQSGVHLLVAVGKLALLGAIVVAYLEGQLGTCLALAAATPLAALTTAFQLVFGLVARITIALAVIAVGDVLYQRWQYRRTLRMTREEVREERRSHEGPPIARSRIRSIHLAMVRKRMLRQVPQADVVVTNPSHVAVALKYDAATMAAPTVLAKGADLLAEEIKRIAREHHVAVVEKPELARAIYATVEVGQFIPEALYIAVAEILAMIYRLRKQRA